MINDCPNAGLCHNHTLLTLEIGSNQVTDVGAGYMSEVFKMNKKLEGLSLWQNEITAEVRKGMGKFMHNINFCT